MPDPHQPPPASPESGLKLPATHKGLLGNVSVMLLAGIVLLSGAYFLSHLPQVGRLVEDAIRYNRNNDFPAFGAVLYGIGSLTAFLILLGLLRCCDHLLRHFRETSPLKSRPAKALEQFIDEAAAASISPRVARESFHLLEPHYPLRMCIDLCDDLRSDLRLSDEAIRALDALLRTRCERRQVPVIASLNSTPSSSEPVLVTVLDLLQDAESAPPLREDRSASGDRANGTSGSPSRQRRLSDSAQRKALHAATLSAIEAGSPHTPDSSGPHRRYTDYNGPRRRATDDRRDVEYSGPYQRATDRTQDRPPASSPERKTQPAVFLADLNLVDSPSPREVRSTHLSR